MKKSIIVFFIVSCVFSLKTIAQDSLPNFITDSLDVYLRSEQERWKIPALAVSIVKDGKVVKMYTNGVTDYRTKIPIDENTLFMIGSNTKAFTGILMAMLADEKKLSLEDPVKKWLPYFKLYDDYRTENTNIIDVLSHRVGFETFQGDFLNFDNELTSEEIIRKFALIKPTYSFREKWGYFNTGYTIAGEIVKEVTGYSWAEQIHERIFSPLEMNNSLALSENILKASNATKAHTLVDGDIVEIDYGDIDATAPAGSISSSIADMSKWVITLLNDGKFKENQIIPSEAINETIVPRSMKGTARNPFSLYGLGWDIEDHGESTFIMHTGGIHGYVTSVTMVPSENLGVIILTNTDSNYLFEGLKFDIVNPFLDKPVYRVSERYYEFFERSKNQEKDQKESWLNEIAEKNTTSIPLKSFVGKYVNEIYGWLKIKEEKGKLNIEFEHHKSLTVSLSHLSEDKFLASFSNVLYGESVFPFEIENGTVKKFTLKLHPQVEQTTYEFYKQ